MESKRNVGLAKTGLKAADTRREKFLVSSTAVKVNFVIPPKKKKPKMTMINAVRELIYILRLIGTTGESNMGDRLNHWSLVAGKYTTVYYHIS